MKTILDKISKYSNNAYITDAWLNGQTGEIVDIKGDCVFRFIDYDTEGELRIKHTTEESMLSCPIVACGIVGYWLHRKDSEGIKNIFEGYYQLRLNEYEKAHESDDDAWNRDLKREFVRRFHISSEKKLIKSSEALFPYITEDDQKKVKRITENYLKFARSKRKELYPPQHPSNRIIEDTFLDAYRVGGPAYECMSWMRIEYNLPCSWPHWRNDNITEKELLSDRRKKRHEKVIPEFIAEEYEDFDDSVLKYTNGGLMDEIDENLRNCQTQEDRIRYIISLLQPFKDFAEAFNAKALIDERKRSIKEHEKWIKNWEGMPDDAVDERTGKPIRPKEQIAACNEFIDEYKQDIEYWIKVQKDFYWFAQHGLGAGHYRTYPQEVNDQMCKYLGSWWECMIFFARRLAALVLTYGIKLMDVQETCGIYLTWYFMIHDYVDYKHITNVEHARKLLNEIEAKKPKNEASDNVKPSTHNTIKEQTNKNVSDFEHLIDYQDNSDLDYYLSKNHWNYHVNKLLYTYLKVRHYNTELGLYLDLVLSSSIKEGENYSSLYGAMFNEAYRLCKIVLTTQIPETQVALYIGQAAKIYANSKGSHIVSYHILVMVNTLLCLANDTNDSIGSFLHALSIHDDLGMIIDNKTQHFADYIKVGLQTVAGIIIDGQINSPGKLRPGYKYKERDSYLRNTIPYYRVSAEELELRVKESKDKKTGSIQKQNNINSNVFNGPVTIINNKAPNHHMLQRADFWYNYKKNANNKSSMEDGMDSRQGKHGAKTTKFEDYIINKKETCEVISIIKKQINKNDAKQTALVIIGGIEAGKIRRDVTAPSIGKEFGVKDGSIKPHLTKYRHYKEGNGNSFSDEELKPYKDLFCKEK